MENQIFEFLSNHPLLSSGWLAAGLLLLWNVKKGATAAVSSQQLVNLINREQALVLDIRNSGEFGKSHIAGSKNIQLTKLPKQLNTLENWKTKPIVVVCNVFWQFTAMTPA